MSNLPSVRLQIREKWKRHSFVMNSKRMPIFARFLKLFMIKNMDFTQVCVASEIAGNSNLQALKKEHSKSLAKKNSPKKAPVSVHTFENIL